MFKLGLLCTNLGPSITGEGRGDQLDSILLRLNICITSPSFLETITNRKFHWSSWRFLRNCNRMSALINVMHDACHWLVNIFLSHTHVCIYTYVSRASLACRRRDSLLICPGTCDKKNCSYCYRGNSQGRKNSMEFLLHACNVYSALFHNPQIG